MQTILGSGGAIGVELTSALRTYTEKIRLVSRHPEKVNPADELFPADLLDAEQVMKAVEGSTVVYLTIGFPYNVKVWQERWPRCMQNVIDACKAHKAKLVFFDNIYMYDPGLLNGMTEETGINPSSKKGKIRAQLVKMIMDEIAQERLTALIARSADFYGPGIQQTSMLNETVIKPLSSGKKANWLGGLEYKHSFTYTPDAGKATALLGNTDSAFNQVWHLPTSGNPPTMKEWITLCAEALGVEPATRTVTPFMMKLMGIFVPIMREFPEMLYQYNTDYVFNSDKFEKTFDFSPTPYTEGIKAVIEADYPK